MRRLPINLFCAGLFLSPIAAIAETPAKIGRLPDGRAYRIDNQGMRLIDHIAELEVDNADLQRQLIALENELGQKQALVKSLEAGKCGSTLRESSIGGTPSAELPRAAGLPQPSTSDAEVQVLRSELQGKTNLIAELEQKNNGLAAALASAQQEAVTAKSTPVSAPVAAAPRPAADQRARLAPVSLDTTETRSTQAALKKTIAEINSLILKRKDLIDALKSSKKGVSVKVQPLVSSEGDSLDSLRAKVAALTPADAARVEAGLTDIRRILHDDINVMRRLKTL